VLGRVVCGGGLFFSCHHFHSDWSLAWRMEGRDGFGAQWAWFQRDSDF
jgi:hypothetical protein